MGQAEEEVGSATGVAALNLAEFVCRDLAIVKRNFVRGACVLREHQAKGVDGGVELGGSRDTRADGDGEFALGDEGEAYCAGEVEGEVFEGPV